MKKLLLQLVLLLFMGQGWSQNDTTIIKIDFKGKCFTEGIKEVEYLKKGDFFQLEVNDINMNLYKVIVDKKDTAIASNITSFPTFDLVNMRGVDELLGKLFLSTISFPYSRDSSAEVSFANKDEKQIQIEKTQDTIADRIRSEINTLNSKNNLIKILKGEIDDIQLAIQMKILSYSVLYKSDDNYRLLSRNIRLDSILVQTGRLRANVKSLSKNISILQSEYSNFTSRENIRKIINDDKNKELKEADKKLTEAYSQAISNADKLYESINSEKVASWIKELIYKENNSCFSFKTLPQQLTNDQTTLTIKIIPVKEEYGLPNYETKIIFPQRKPFYVGIGTSFYFAWFKNENYSTKATVLNDEETNYQIVDEKNKKGELGLATHIHFGWRLFCDNRKADWIALNLVTGPALSFTNTIKPRVTIGGGFAFGRKNMLTINYLYMGGYVDKKSENFNTSDVYSSEPKNVTVSKLAGSSAISLGYIYKF